MVTAQITHAIDAQWLNVPFVRLGDVPHHLPTPNLYVTILDDEEPLLRADVYDDSRPRVREAVVWQNWVVVGYGSELYLINWITRELRTVHLGYFFNYLYPSDSYLLATSDEGMICLDPSGHVRWSLENLALDGVVVNEVIIDTIFAEGEWDPPGGWISFQVSLATGSLLNS